MTPAGAAECTLRIDWAGLPIAYPALLDPAWDATDAMADWRFWHSATTLLDGRALVVGGQSVESTELYDPETGTFASAGVLPQGDRFHHTATRLPDGRVLVAGGAPCPDVGGAAAGGGALYDPVAGTWTLAGPLALARWGHSATLLPDGRAMVATGETLGDLGTPTCEVFDPVTDTWAPLADAPYSATHTALTVLGDGTVLMAGGGLSGRFASLGDSATFDPLADGWTSTPPLSLARSYHTISALPDGGALAIAGFRDLAPTDVVERFDLAAGSWDVVAPLNHARHWHTTTPLVGGRFLVAGGSSTILSDGAMRSTEIYDPNADTSTDAEDMVEARAVHRDAALPDGSALITGGLAENNVLSSAERFSLAAAGTACLQPGTCGSGYCVDGVCCDAACDGPCSACSAQTKGGGDDGVRGPVADGSDPDDDCLDSGAQCGDTGLCDGLGSCAQYPDEACTPGPCTTGDQCATGFCADGVCCDQACDGPCRSCSRATGALVDGVCQGAAPGTSEASACAPYGCNADGTCRDTCASVDDCAAPTVCSEDGRCDNADRGDVDAGDDGCGCVVAGGPAERSGLVPLVLWVFALARRRRGRGRLA
ncbi:MAG: kelch repeat-containing protein [Polyangiaceae bacterium]